jgi:ubiquinone/menaquinone biosynthesis C-methylase UbiE
VSDRRIRKVQRIYDHDAEAYHRAMQSRFMEWVLGGRRRKVGETVRGRVLDVGFGTGLSVAEYPADVQVVGIDVSPGMLEVGRRFARDTGHQVEVEVMDAEHMAFPDHVFDSVAFNLCLCTIGDPERAVRQALRVARPGAPMVFLEHVRSHVLPVALVQEVLSPLLAALVGDHFNRRTVSTIRRAGVEVISVDRFAWGFFNLVVGRAPQAT